MRNVTCSNPAHIPLNVMQHGHADYGSWCVECPDGKENVWYEDTSRSIKCAQQHLHYDGVAPTAKVRATLGSVLAPVSVSSAPVQYADATVEDCPSTDSAFCGSYCRGEDASTQAIEDATAVPSRTRLTPLSILNITAPEEAAFVEYKCPDGTSEDHAQGPRCLRCVCSFSSSGVVGARLVCLYSVSRSPWGAARVLDS